MATSLPAWFPPFWLRYFIPPPPSCCHQFHHGYSKQTYMTFYPSWFSWLCQACVTLAPDLWAWMRWPQAFYILMLQSALHACLSGTFLQGQSDMKLKLWEWSASHTAVKLLLREVSCGQPADECQASVVMKCDWSEEASAKAGGVGDWNKSCIPQFCAKNGLIFFFFFCWLKKKLKLFLTWKKITYQAVPFNNVPTFVLFVFLLSNWQMGECTTTVLPVFFFCFHSEKQAICSSSVPPFSPSPAKGGWQSPNLDLPALLIISYLDKHGHMLKC